MKAATILTTVAVVASASAFAPNLAAPKISTTALNAKKTIFQSIVGMDLFAPDKEVNDYGARNRKSSKTGAISEGKSYVPNGLTAAEYNKVRAEADKKKASNYQRNVNKAGKFSDYTDFYLKRGTDVTDSWIKSVTRGHDMVKTKYDWSGKQNNQKDYDGSK